MVSLLLNRNWSHFRNKMRDGLCHLVMCEASFPSGLCEATRTICPVFFFFPREVQCMRGEGSIADVYVCMVSKFIAGTYKFVGGSKLLMMSISL